MHLENVHIQDWRNIEDATLECKPLTIILGANHNGKTSVKQAIKVAFTCADEGTTADGKGANDKIRLGAKKAKIELGIQAKSGLMPFAVTYGPGKTGRQVVTENPAPFLNWLLNNNERLSCALDSEYFIKQKPEDQKNVLAGLVLPQTATFEPALVELAKQQFGTIDWTKRPLDVISLVYDLAFDKRKIAKAQLNANHIPQLPEKKPSNRTVEEIKSILQGLRDKASKIRSERPQIDTGELQRLVTEQNEIGGKLFRAEAESGETRTAIADAEANILQGPSLKTYEKVAANRAIFDKLQAQVNVIISQIEDQRAAQSVWREFLSEKKCPTCTQPITEAFISDRIAEIEQTIKNQSIKQNELMRDQRDLGNIEEAERLVAAHKEAIGQKDTLQRQLAEEVADISTLKERQRDLKAKIEAAKGATEDAGKPDPELDKLNGEITKGEGILEAAIRYDAIVKQIEEGSQRARDLTAKVEALEKLCQYFGKDGVKAKLINEHIAQFSTSVNRVLEVWGYKAELQIEPYSFIVTTQEGRSLPLKELSGSERLMFGVALQSAIAHHGKIGMIVVDKADTFINSERGKLFKALMTLIRAGFIEQAIVMVAEDKAEAPTLDGVVYYAAQSGKLVKL